MYLTNSMKFKVFYMLNTYSKYLRQKVEYLAHILCMESILQLWAVVCMIINFCNEVQ